MADTVASARALSRSAHINAAPSLANRFAIAVPSPPPAPVTNATFPFSLIDLLPTGDDRKQRRSPARISVFDGHDRCPVAKCLGLTSASQLKSYSDKANLSGS